MILVDSSVWIDFFNGINRPHVDKLYQILGNEVIVTGDLIVVKIKRSQSVVLRDLMNVYL